MADEEYFEDAVDVADDGGKGGGKATDHMSNTFYERIARGNNLTKMGSSTRPRDVAMLIAAQARAPVRAPRLASFFRPAPAAGAPRGCTAPRDAATMRRARVCGPAAARRAKGERTANERRSSNDARVEDSESAREKMRNRRYAANARERTSRERSSWRRRRARERRKSSSARRSRDVLSA